MSIFTSLSDDTKLDIVSNQKRAVLERTYLYLIRLGINPETFNKETYTPTSEGDLEEGDIYSQNELVKALEEFDLLCEIEDSLT
jgi:hypothetical protein